MNRPSNDIFPQELARMTIETFISYGTIIDPPVEPHGVLGTRAGVFVTLRALEGQLRGCIGTIEPVHSNVAEEIVHNAISAATRDPRFPPISRTELSVLSYGVDVLSTSEPASGPDDLDPSVYGVIIETLDGSRRGLLLPRIHGIHSVQEQWLAVHSKAGIIPGTAVRTRRFSITRFGEED